MLKLEGTLPALLTPFTPDDRVNVPLLRDLTDHFIAKQVSGFYLCGNTGEGVFMSVEERQLLVETVIPHIHGRVPAIVHVGAAALTDAIRLARHARDHGAAAISSILPPVGKDPHGIVAYYESLAAATPDLCFFPYLHGGGRDAVSLMRDISHIPNLGGTKYTGPDMYEMSRIIALGSTHWTVFSGMDEQCLFAAMFGASSNIGSTVNLMPGAFVRIHRDYHSGNWPQALALQQRVNRVIETLYQFGFAGAFRTAMKFVGLDCGRPRVPNMPLAESKHAELRAALQAIGFFEIAAM